VEILFKTRSEFAHLRPEQVKQIHPKTLLVGDVDMKEKCVVGVDASTTAFGFTVYSSKNRPTLFTFLRDSSQDRHAFMSECLPYIGKLLEDMTLRSFSFERTPTLYAAKTHAERVMKETERLVRQFVDQRATFEIETPQNIFDIFPNSWKARYVPKDIINNPGKKNKILNAAGILQSAGLEAEFWLKEHNQISNHDYDSFEAFGIAQYGDEFILNPPFIRTYRDFAKRRPLEVCAIPTDSTNIMPLMRDIKAHLRGVPLVLYQPNEYHSVMENIYSLDQEKRVPIMFLDKEDPIRFYLQHILNIGREKSDKELLALFTLRVNHITDHTIGQLKANYGLEVTRL